MDKDLKIAILIDADNISDKYVKIILDETASKGGGHLQKDLWGLDQP